MVVSGDPRDAAFLAWLLDRVRPTLRADGYSLTIVDAPVRHLSLDRGGQKPTESQSSSLRQHDPFVTRSLLTLDEVGQLLGKSARTIDRQVKAGRLAAVRFAGSLMVRPDDLDVFVAGLPTWRAADETSLDLAAAGGGSSSSMAAPSGVGESSPPEKRSAASLIPLPPTVRS